jgi:hypothetical protein
MVRTSGGFALVDAAGFAGFRPESRATASRTDESAKPTALGTLARVKGNRSGKLGLERGFAFRGSNWKDKHCCGGNGSQQEAPPGYFRRFHLKHLK